ncbi:MAG TPA: cation-translocating P-type ATPase [Anaerolineales bacterium]|nr:cation-translocating P-type ATPase [Anaerolineales bacterium]
MPSYEIEYAIQGMDCANCALTLERSLAQLQGVERVQVNFTAAVLTASGTFDPQALVARVEAMGYRASPPETKAALPQPMDAETQPAVVGFLQFLLSERSTTMALVGGILLLVSALLGWVATPWAGWLSLALQISVSVVAGYPIANKGLRALLVGRQVTIDLLMTIATLGALFIGETGEAATVILLFTIGEALEGFTAERSRRSLRSLLALTPDQARVLRPCIDCAEHLGQDGYNGGVCPFCGMHEVAIPASQVQVGERVVVQPGERVPVDGVVRNGTAAVNQAPVTGESVPVEKAPGDAVYAGSLNGEAALEIEALRPAGDSTISRIVRLVQQAQAQRAPVERFIDRFAAWYTPAVVLLAACLAIIPPLFGGPFFDQPDGTRGWLYRALALLIVACPCALVISTPVSIVSALTGLARRGVLVKGGAFLDTLARVRTFAFDKTGTLTHGKPVVMETFTLSCPPGTERCEACDDMLAVAAAVERRSAHPLAQAIVNESQARSLEHVYPSAETVQALAGQGVQGLANGEEILVGNHAMIHDRYPGCNGLHEQVQAAEQKGRTVMLVGRAGQVLGYVSVADSERPNSAEALRALKAIDPAMRRVMLTGDNPAVAQRIADNLGGVDEVRASLLPEEKLDAIRGLQSQGELVAMVGDGVNDAPALAAASVGIAMGGAGSAQAMETADVVLMQDDLASLPALVKTSRRTRNIIIQNIVVSLALKAVFLLLTLPGWATLWMAVFADMGASLLVTLNGMRAGSDH